MEQINKIPFKVFLSYVLKYITAKIRIPGVSVETVMGGFFFFFLLALPEEKTKSFLTAAKKRV